MKGCRHTTGRRETVEDFERMKTKGRNKTSDVGTCSAPRQALL